MKDIFLSANLNLEDFQAVHIESAKNINSCYENDLFVVAFKFSIQDKSDNECTFKLEAVAKIKSPNGSFKTELKFTKFEFANEKKLGEINKFRIDNGRKPVDAAFVINVNENGNEVKPSSNYKLSKIKIDRGDKTRFPLVDIHFDNNNHYSQNSLEMMILSRMCEFRASW